MPSKLRILTDANLVKPPRWLPDNVCYETIMGSVAYGVSDDTSDMDIYGFGMPQKEVIFPHLGGYIPGFSTQIPNFDQYIQHHIENPTELKGKGRTYDITIFSIIKYFKLLMENNPNVIDSLFVPFECILHQTKVGQIVRENRKIFLHRGSWHKFKGYSYSQLNKMTSKNRDPKGKRFETFQKYGYDLKFGLHTVRLLLEIEQILSEGDLDLRRHNEQLKSIRRGEWTEEELRTWASEKEKGLEKLYENSKLPWGPDESAIKQLLINCLEEHYGNISNCIVQPDAAVLLLKDIQKLLDKNQQLING